MGIDLAWRDDNHSGVVVARGDARRAELVRPPFGVTSFDEAAEVVAQHAEGETVVAIDAPLIIENATGQRPCERQVSRTFGHAHAGTYPSNRALFPDGGPARLTAMLAERGFKHITEGSGGRRMMEVYPHAGHVSLFGLPTIIRYKKGRVAAKRDGLRQLRALYARLETGEPALLAGEAGRAFLAHDPELLKGESLKRYEDLLDAWFCAYVAMHMFRWNTARNRVFGDSASGYIVVPAP